jgi:hypothetical protein
MVSPISACDSVISPPPPNPCSTRAAVSQLMVGATAQNTEPVMKTTSATSIMCRRPNESPRRP